MDEKFCIKCGQILPIEMFCKNGSRKDGRDNVCRACRRKQYLREHTTARRYFPDEITDEEILRECRKRGLIE